MILNTLNSTFTLTQSIQPLSYIQMEPVPYQKLLSKTHIFIGVVLSLLVFILMSYLLRPFTFSQDTLIAQAQACFTAIPITAVFWFAYHMFMLVLVDQRKRNKKSK